jgi:hypothetical protein
MKLFIINSKATRTRKTIEDKLEQMLRAELLINFGVSNPSSDVIYMGVQTLYEMGHIKWLELNDTTGWYQGALGNKIWEPIDVYGVAKDLVEWYC